ncbi:2738_t:CDS:1, partial [Racocetra fulgida]
KNIKVFYEYCQLMNEARYTALQMLKVEAKPGIIYKAVKDKDEASTATRKYISNL